MRERSLWRVQSRAEARQSHLEIWRGPGPSLGDRADLRPWGPRRQGPGPRKVDTLTYEAGDEHPGDSLLPHLLNLGLVTRRNGSAHNSQRVDVGDRADGGGREPGQPEQPTEPTQRANQQQVQVEARAFEQPPSLLTDDKTAGEDRRKRAECPGRQASGRARHTRRGARQWGERVQRRALPRACQLPLPSSQTEVLTSK